MSDRNDKRKDMPEGVKRKIKYANFKKRKAAEQSRQESSQQAMRKYLRGELK